MRFKLRKKPEVGIELELTRFAWFPKEVDGYLVWLEKYTQRGKYFKDTRNGSIRFDVIYKNS